MSKERSLAALSNLCSSGWEISSDKMCLLLVSKLDFILILQLTIFVGFAQSCIWTFWTFIGLHTLRMLLPIVPATFGNIFENTINAIFCNERFQQRQGRQIQWRNFSMVESVQTMNMYS